MILGLLLLHVALLTDVVEAAGAAIDDAWDGAWDARLEAVSAGDVASWVIPLVLAALLVVSWFVPRWPEASAARAQARSVVTVAAGIGVLDAVVTAELPVWAAVSVLLVVAAALVVADVRRLTVVAGPVAAVLILVACTLAASNQGVSAVSWLVGAIGLGLLAHVDSSPWLRQPCAGVATALAIAGAAAALDDVGTPQVATLLVALAIALALLAASGLPLREHPVRLPVEAVAGISALVVLVVNGSTAELAVRWTIAGVVLIALSFVVDDRRWYLAPGIGSLVVAYVLLIVDSGFSFVEAYTLPIGAAALGVGLFAARRRPSSSTWLLLGPGLALALLPSIPQALADPTGLRALLLGVGALVTLAAGVRLGWQAPFVTGVTVVTLLVLFNVGPYANAAPRVVLIAVVSAILLGVGITWEDRVRDSRLLVKYVRSMR